MSDPIQITRKNYWAVNGNNHTTEVEAFQDAANQALAAPNTQVQVQPPAYTVVYTAPAQPPVDPPPSDPVAGFEVSVGDMTAYVTDESQTNGGSESWDFGDGFVGTGYGDQVHTYMQAGTYTITLTITGVTGGTWHASQSVNVPAPAIPPSPAGGIDAIGALAPGQTITPPEDA